MIRAHDCKCGLIKRDPGRTPPDPGNPYNIVLQDPETAGTYGMVTMCIGGGMGEAIIVERDELCK